MRRRFVTLDVFTNRRFAGNPLAVKFTTPLNPNCAVTEIEEAVNPPIGAVTDPGDADTEKSGVLTVRFTPCVYSRFPLIP